MRTTFLLLAVLGLPLASGCSGSKSAPANSGPYVQSITSSTAIVAIQTAGPATVRLKYGVTSADEHTVVEPEAVQVHGLQAKGLLPDTRYVYKLETSDGLPMGEGSFRTAPDSRQAPCTFLVVGDTGGTDEEQGEVIDAARVELDKIRGAYDDENQQDAVANAMLQREADLIVHTGDVVYPAGAREDYAEGFFQPFAALISTVPMFPTLGNHDLKTENGAPFLETFFVPNNGHAQDGRSYSFDWGCVHFVCLDVVSAPTTAGDEQLTWLQKDLAASTAAWNVVFFHVPVYSPLRKDSEPLITHLAPILEEAGVDLVLQGHDHAYSRFLPRGKTNYVVSGGGGKSLYKVGDRPELAYSESVFHFVEVKAVPGQLTLHAIDLSGSPFDELIVRK